MSQGRYVELTITLPRAPRHEENIVNADDAAGVAARLPPLMLMLLCQRVDGAASTYTAAASLVYRLRLMALLYAMLRQRCYACAMICFSLMLPAPRAASAAQRHSIRRCRQHSIST